MNQIEQSIIQGKAVTFWKKLHWRGLRLWDSLLQQLGLRGPRYWGFRSSARVFADDEPFIRLYWVVSNGGCHDFTEEIRFTEDDQYSYLKFHHDHQPGYAHFFPLVLGVVNIHRGENICENFLQNVQPF